MHYLILAATFALACYTALTIRSRSMVYQPVPVTKRRRNR